MSMPRGIIPALITVFNEDYTLDEGGTQAFAKQIVDRGVHGIAPCGTSGEAFALSGDEKRRVIRSAVAGAGGRVPVYAGITDYSTAAAIDSAKAAIDQGASGLMVLLPHQYEPPIPAVMRHLTVVSRAVDMPIMVYNNPNVAGYELSPEQLKILVDDGVVNSAKMAHGDPMRMNYLNYVCGKDKMSGLYGHDIAPLEAFFAGAQGWLAVIPNVMPELSVQLFDAVTEKKDVDLAHRIWGQMLPYSYYFVYEAMAPNADGNPSPHWVTAIKESLAMLGQNVGPTRPPADPMTDGERAILRKYLFQGNALAA